MFCTPWIALKGSCILTFRFSWTRNYNVVSCGYSGIPCKELWFYSMVRLLYSRQPDLYCSSRGGGASSPVRLDDHCRAFPTEIFYPGFICGWNASGRFFSSESSAPVTPCTPSQFVLEFSHVHQCFSWGWGWSWEEQSMWNTQLCREGLFIYQVWGVICLQIQSLELVFAHVQLCTSLNIYLNVYPSYIIPPCS